MKYASDPQYFKFLSDCSKSKPDFVVGDARLKLVPLPAGSLDMLIVDAFSSDTIPAHLLTIEAITMYLSKIKDDGVVVFNLSNRLLELRDPVLASVKASGGQGLSQLYIGSQDGTLADSPTITLVAVKNSEAWKEFSADPRWKNRDKNFLPWSDDYVNIVGAFRLNKVQE